MEGLKKVVGAYMVAVAVVVAVFFIINSFLVDSFNVLDIWYVLDVLMLIGLALALIFNYLHKREVGSRDPDQPVPGIQRRILPDRGSDGTVPAQLVFATRTRRRQPGRQSPSLGNMGCGRHAAAPSPGCYGLPSLAASLRFLNAGARYRRCDVVGGESLLSYLLPQTPKEAVELGLRRAAHEALPRSG